MIKKSNEIEMLSKYNNLFHNGNVYAIIRFGDCLNIYLKSVQVTSSNVTTFPLSQDNRIQGRLFLKNLIHMKMNGKKANDIFETTEIEKITLFDLKSNKLNINFENNDVINFLEVEFETASWMNCFELERRIVNKKELLKNDNHIYELLTFSKYTSYFHDGDLIEILHKKNLIEIAMLSAEVDEEEVVDIPLSKKRGMTVLKGNLCFENVDSIIIDGKVLHEKLKMVYDLGEIFNLEITDKATMQICWENNTPAISKTGCSTIEISAEKIYWKNYL